MFSIGVDCWVLLGWCWWFVNCLCCIFVVFFFFLWCFIFGLTGHFRVFVCLGFSSSFPSDPEVFFCFYVFGWHCFLGLFGFDIGPEKRNQCVLKQGFCCCFLCFRICLSQPPVDCVSRLFLSFICGPLYRMVVIEHSQSYLTPWVLNRSPPFGAWSIQRDLSICFFRWCF